MLKWAVGGHHQARAEPPCCTAIRRPPFKRAKRANNTTVYDKENENGSGSRDSSVYMRLEAVPVALRDLSNHQTPPADVRLSPKVKRPRTCASPPKLEVEKKVIKEEKRKLPCALDGHGQTRVCLDSDRSLFQIEYTPGARRVPRSPTMDDHIYFLDHTASPVELDHKEIPLEQKKKDIILSTPGRLILQDTITSDSTPRTAGVSPLARRFAFLELSRTAAGSDIFDSPDETPIKPRPSYLSTTATIPMPLLPPTLPECETLKAWVEANRHLDTTPLKPPSDTSTRSGRPFRKPTGSTVSEASSAKTFIVNDDSPRSRITNHTNHDRNSASCESLFKSPIFEGGMDDVKVKSILVNRYSSLPSISETGLGDTSRKRRGVIFNDTTFTLNTPPSEEERASSSAWSVDACAPSTLKRQRVVRRRKGRRKHPISDLSGGGRLGLTLPDGIPSPPSPPDLALPLRSPTWGSAKLSDSLTPAQTSTSTRMDYEADSSSTGSSLTISPIGTETDSAGSRRCLFSSPPGERLSRRGNSFTPRSGELELSMFCNNGLLTIHVIRGRNLQALSGLCNAYVKVCLVGCGTYHRTCVKKDSSNPRFDQSFSFQLRDEDMDRRVLVSAWHRDRSNRKSEFLGCMSFAVRNVLKKDIQGRYRLLSQGSGRLGHLPAISNGQANSADVMANQSESSVEELVSIDESDVPPTPEAGKERKRLNSTRKDYGKVIEDYIFLRYLELDPETDEQAAEGTSSGASRRGRTPFTTTRTLRRQPGNSFGFSIAWTHPPRVERVESGLPADQAGLRPGDYIIFVEKSNVVTMKEEQILEIIKSCGNQIILESYRKAPNTGGRPLSHPGAVAVSPRACSAANVCSTAPCSANACSTAACSAATTTASLDVSKKRLHFPHVTFTSEVGSGILV